MSAYRVRISKDNLMFAAGHFVSYDGDKVSRCMATTIASA